MLIQGVESSRLQIPPSRLYLHIVFQEQLRKNEVDQIMEFDGEKRRVENLAPKSANAKSMFFDGEQVCLYNVDRKEVTLRDIGDSTPDVLFDPRVLGLSILGWSDRISDVLPYKEGRVEMVGREPVGDVDAWHVRISMNKVQEYTIDLWIGDSERFPVYRYELTFDSGKQRIFSFYENKDYPWLPSKMEHSCLYADRTVHYKLTVELTKAEANVPFSETN